MGMLLAWCANMHLLSADFQQEHDRMILRLRMREIGGSDLLIASGGDLTEAMFNDQGRAFLDGYYDKYFDDVRSVLGDLHSFEDNWDNYSKLAQLITARYMAKSKPGLFAKFKLPRWITGRSR